MAVDPTGRLPGRGAYLCRTASCWDLAARKRALEHALKTTIPADVVAFLAAGPDTVTATPNPGNSNPRIPAAHELDAPGAPHDTEGGAHGQE